MAVNVDQIKQLRDETQASIGEVKTALEEAGGDMEKARKVLRERGFEKAAKKAERVAEQGIVDAYIHLNGKVGVLVELLCETDFVARTDEFKKLAKELGMQIAAMDPKDVDALLKQEYIRDSSKTIESLIREEISRLGENIVLKRFSRFEIGKKEETSE